MYLWELDLAASQSLMRQLILYSMSIPTPLLCIKSHLRRRLKKVQHHMLRKFFKIEVSSKWSMLTDVAIMTRFIIWKNMQWLLQEEIEEAKSLDTGYEEFLWSLHPVLWQRERKIEIQRRIINSNVNWILKVRESYVGIITFNIPMRESGNNLLENPKLTLESLKVKSHLEKLYTMGCYCGLVMCKIMSFASVLWQSI